MRRFNIDFMGNRNIMFGISLVLIVIAIGALGIRHLKFGVEFEGGTVISVSKAANVTQEQMTDAFKAAGITQLQVQESQINGVRGFIIRSSETSAAVSNNAATKAAAAVSLPAGEFQVTTIGPDWGKNITSSALVALAVSILAILLYVSIRFEYKMSVTAVIALVHDILITLGLYALVGWEVTPNVVAALLAILGYSLYDTIVVFHRMKENSQGLVKQSFMSMANRSINEVLVRSINTTLTSLVPVVVLLLFGGATLKDYALALTIGLTSGAYSSIGVAAPLFAMWKEMEPKYAALAKKYASAS
ncbi:MAG TPA: protein translocase subunit SecF [Coriobacteriia bacterium]